MVLDGLRLSGMVTPPPHLYITCTSHNIHVSFTATAKVALMLWISEITDFQGIWLIPLVSQHCLPSPFSAVHSNSILEVISSGDLQAPGRGVLTCSSAVPGDTAGGKWHCAALCCQDTEVTGRETATGWHYNCLSGWSPRYKTMSYPGLRENYST